MSLDFVRPLPVGTRPAHRRRAFVGSAHPLGARYDGSGTNFSIFSSVAEGVELCLLGGDDDTSDEECIELR
jgi:pullulanase/glycogen debranching enzyme